MSAPLHLASQSPRRRELLASRDIPFRVLSVDVDEDQVESTTPEGIVVELSLRKARAGAALVSDGHVLGSDTLVFLDDEPLGKPADEAEAHAMLRRLSGREHRVLSGLAIVEAGGGREWSAHDATTIVFRPLDDREIAEYVASGEPMGKAGAYAIQGGAEAFVAERRGSLSNVIGLPLERLDELLSSLR